MGHFAQCYLEGSLVLADGQKQYRHTFQTKEPVAQSVLQMKVGRRCDPSALFAFRFGPTSAANALYDAFYYYCASFGCREGRLFSFFREKSDEKRVLVLYNPVRNM
jgi:hypothetical protein